MDSRKEKEPLLGNSAVETQYNRQGQRNPTFLPQLTGDSKIVMNGKDSDDLDLSFHNINVFYSKRKKRFTCCKSDQNSYVEPKHILRNVSGVVHSNQLLAVMGASGAGKTTLLNILTARKMGDLLVDGDVRINGNPISHENFVKMSAYVQQEDLFIGSLTVREQLIFQAILRMDRSIQYSQRMKRVEEVIVELGLTKCADTVIGDPGSAKSISGGEMKRLGFAAEVLTNPPLMFCDEPTSGLDSFMAQNVVSVLKNMAAKGKVVVSTIHQPSSEVFEMFDRIMLMAEGRVAFLGNRDEAYEFFKTQGFECPHSFNPADFYILTLAIVPGYEDERRKRVEVLCDQFDSSIRGQALMESIAQTKANNYSQDDDLWSNNKTSRYKASIWTQFRTLLWRSTLTMLREPHLLKARFFQSIFVAMLLGVIFFGQVLNQEGVMNINGCIFLLLTNMTFQNVFGVIHVFCLELPIFYREHDNGMYRTGVYYWAKTFAEAPLFILIAIMFTAIPYWMAGLYPDPIKFAYACVIVILVAHTSCSFGYLMSTCSPTITVALSIAAPLVAPLLFFGGFFLNAKSFPNWLYWMQYLSWFRYSNEALLINQWNDINYIECNRSNNQTCYKDGSQVIDSFNFETDNFLWDIVFLCGQLFLYRFIAYIALVIRVKARN